MGLGSEVRLGVPAAREDEVVTESSGGGRVQAQFTW